jgi:dimethylglycine dehydrogenase
MTNTMPKTGRLILTPMLNENGKLIGDFTIARVSKDHFYMFGSSQAEVYHMRWFEQHLPDDGSVAIRAINLGWVGLSIAGPKSRDVLTKVVGEDVSNAAFRFMDFREMDVANAPCKVNRISYTGDLGYEIWMAPEYERQVYMALKEAGAEFGIKDFGMRALLCLRLEKNFGTWFREFRPVYGAFEADLGRFVKLDKPEFIGKAAAQKEFEEGPKRKRVAFDVDAGDADVMGDEPIWHQDKVIGWITSGGYAHHVQKSLAQGYVPSELAEITDGGAFEVEILGERRKATILLDPPFDPKAERMRM